MVVTASLSYAIHYAIKIVPFIAIGIFVTNFVVKLGFMKKFDRLIRPLSSRAGISSTSALSVVTCTFSSTAGYSMLSQALSSKSISEREVLAVSLITSFPSILSHMLTFFIPVVIPILGFTTGVIYVGLRCVVSLLKTFLGIFLARLWLNDPGYLPAVPLSSVSGPARYVVPVHHPANDSDHHPAHNSEHHPVHNSHNHPVHNSDYHLVHNSHNHPVHNSDHHSVHNSHNHPVHNSDHHSVHNSHNRPAHNYSHYPTHKHAGNPASNGDQKDALNSSIAGTYKMLKRIVPVMLITLFLTSVGIEMGVFESLSNVLDPITELLGLESDIALISATELVNTYSGMVLAGSLLGEGIISIKGVLIALLLGNVISFSTRFAKHSLPLHVSLFGPKLGGKIVAVNGVTTLGIDALIIAGLLLM